MQCTVRTGAKAGGRIAAAAAAATRASAGSTTRVLHVAAPARGSVSATQRTGTLQQNAVHRAALHTSASLRSTPASPSPSPSPSASSPQPPPREEAQIRHWLAGLLCAGGALGAFLLARGDVVDNAAASQNSTEGSNSSSKRAPAPAVPTGAQAPTPATQPGADPGKEHDYGVVHRNDLDPEFFESDAFKLNEEGDVEWHSTSTRPRIVILGTGWGSVSFLKGLDINNYEIVVVSPRNYFLFTPLLPSACTGALEMGSLVEPIRQILLRRHQTRQSQYVEAKAVGLDREKRRVKCVDGNGRAFFVEYDHLIVGVGAMNSTFGMAGVKENAYFLKEAKHARIIRAKILSHFEKAASPTTSLEEKERLLQFVVVGGGPTGVEFAGELIDLLDTDLALQFPSLIPLVRVRMLQSNEHLLNTYDLAISRYAEEKFHELRIQVITNARVQAIDASNITYEDKVTKAKRTIPFGICLWSTGIEPTDFTKSVLQTVAGQDSDKAIVTDACLRMLTEIPKLDRVPKRIIKDAEKSLGGPSTRAAGATAAAEAAAAEEDAPRELAVDDRVYALGDCATTHVPKLARRLKRLFHAADRDGDGLLSYTELRELCGTLSERYPIMSAQMAWTLGQYSQFDVPRQDRGITLEDFQRLIEQADKSVRSYPATAQVASQQGKYLAKRFNAFAKQQVALGLEQQPAPEVLASTERDHLQLAREHAARPEIAVHADSALPAPPRRRDHAAVDLGESSEPFRYRHLGSLAYIGGETAAIDLGPLGTFTGFTAFWAWKSAYLSEAVSLRTRINLAYDWTKTWFFGRDTAKP